MNKRIKELAEEAEEYADSIVDQGGEFHQAYTQKLAELIVQECADLVDRAISDGGIDGRVVKEHFGVEE